MNSHPETSIELRPAWDKSRARQAVLSLLMLLFCARCGSMRLEPPEISLAGVQLEEVRLFESDIRILVRIQNANDQPIAVKGGLFHLYLNGMDLGRGTADSSLSVPAMGSGLLPVTFHLGNLPMIANIRTLLDSRRLDYRLDGTLQVGKKLAFGSRLINASREGVLDLSTLVPEQPYR